VPSLSLKSTDGYVNPAAFPDLRVSVADLVG